MSKVIAITGGARGIGAATAAELRRRGHRVVVGDLEATADGIVALDVTQRDSFEGFLDAARSRHGHVDVLVNNAGVMHVGPFLEETDDWTRRQMEINFFGVVLGMKLALPEMVARGSGHVVNVASMASRLGVRNEAVYTGTKHAVYGVSDAVRQELRGTGVALSVIMPGLVRTQLAAGTTEAKGTTVMGPERVATAIAGVLEKPRFDVYIPRAYGPLDRLLAPLPRRAREAILRLMGAERATASTTPTDRAAYEGRIEALYDPDDQSRGAGGTAG